MFADGGDGSAAGTATGTGGTSESADSGIANRKGDLSNVIYGKASEEPTEVKTTSSKESKTQAFENLIKGEYKEEFAKRTQGIIDERFKKTKGMEETLTSHESILGMLAEKYGVKDASDVKALAKALEEDESFYENEALEKGLTVDQLKEMKRLERENKAFKEAKALEEQRENSQKIYAKWVEDGNALAEKYGITDFNLEAECQNPDFTSLLANGISLEAAYKAVHIDEMMGGAMAKTAETVRRQVANNVTNRQSRPSENGVMTNNNAIFKTDVSKLTKADRDEIDRRVARGEVITF